MCGIVGAAARRNVVPILIDGLRKLEYRGYDSAGIAILNGSMTRVAEGDLSTRVPPQPGEDLGRLASAFNMMLTALDASRVRQRQLVADASHELRTPLTALTGYGELLADEILGPLTGEQEDVVERMLQVAGVTKDDVVYDLGSGDGRLVITAAKKYIQDNQAEELSLGQVAKAVNASTFYFCKMFKKGKGRSSARCIYSLRRSYS